MRVQVKGVDDHAPSATIGGLRGPPLSDSQGRSLYAAEATIPQQRQ